MDRRKDMSLQLVVALLLTGWASAQNNNNNQQTTTQANNNQQTTTAAQPATTATTNNNNNQQTNSQTGNTQTSQTNQGTTQGITGIPTATTASSTITSASSTIDAGSGPTDLPTIAGYGIPTMVVPWTAGAPFMYKSSLPEGTVFICVGALLGAMGAAVLIWRGLVAWSLHRSVKRANRNLLAPTDGKLSKGGYGNSTIALASANMHSMDHLATPAKKPIARASLAQTPAAARNSSLFFSPTAGAGHHTPGTYNSNSVNRSSSYLPSGYYAAPGAAAPGATQIGSGTSRAHARQSRYEVSPPSSPGLPPSRGGASIHGGQQMYTQPSISSLNLHVPGNAQPGGRAPSANLDELFGNDPHTRR
ncbi:hypothetical protein BT63DRAFT_455507 [Microthyrium microscopicum]|uniref:Uncharacterized protein n=1 Tax=Microthyrium microscopicum TaxID=703497 RepID=A0A6A6UD14_9PEZI|nr:hypothetical protein BT63DRAFT_455507 [Microthyrium microscopicum]